MARQRAASAAVSAWKQDMQAPAFRGHSWLLPAEQTTYITATPGSHCILKEVGHSVRQMARISRFVTGHFPLGGYREKFNLTGRRECACGAALETRDHILFECPLWIRLQGRDAVARDACQIGGTGGQGVPTPVPIHDVLQFLTANPWVATFEWYELLDTMVDGGWQRSDAVGRARRLYITHTQDRRLAWERFKRTRAAPTLEDFNRAWFREPGLPAIGPKDLRAYLQG